MFIYGAKLFCFYVLATVKVISRLLGQIKYILSYLILPVSTQVRIKLHQKQKVMSKIQSQIGLAAYKAYEQILDNHTIIVISNIIY